MPQQPRNFTIQTTNSKNWREKDQEAGSRIKQDGNCSVSEANLSFKASDLQCLTVVCFPSWQLLHTKLNFHLKQSLCRVYFLPSKWSAVILQNRSLICCLLFQNLNRSTLAGVEHCGSCGENSSLWGVAIWTRWHFKEELHHKANWPPFEE